MGLQSNTVIGDATGDQNAIPRPKLQVAFSGFAKIKEDKKCNQNPERDIYAELADTARPQG